MADGTSEERVGPSVADGRDEGAGDGCGELVGVLVGT